MRTNVLTFCLLVALTPIAAAQTVAKGGTLAEVFSTVDSPTALQQILSGGDRNGIVDDKNVWVVPTMASAPGQFGAYFKTKVAVCNPTDRSYTIFVTLYNAEGKVKQVSLPMSPSQTKYWDDFLAEAFGYSGAGAVQFDSAFAPPGASPLNRFFVTAEVYTHSPNGKYKTVVANGIQWDRDMINPPRKSYNIGINVSAAQRTNLGAFNASDTQANTITAEVYDANGQKTETITFSLPPNGWSQKAVTVPVTNGKVVWSNPLGAYMYAVTVDNQSNDGTLCAASVFVP